MTQMGFYFDQTRCTGCFTCSVACKDWNDIDAGPVNWLRIQAIEEGRFPDVFVAYFISQCYHCAEPVCIPACPADAIAKRDEDGIVVVDRELCPGNEECDSKCLKACPWNAPQFGPEAGAKMQKCDFCLSRIEQGQQTICVEACPLYALDAGPLDELKAKYGDNTHAEGFSYSDRFKPAVTFKPKQRKSTKRGQD